MMHACIQYPNNIPKCSNLGTCCSLNCKHQSNLHDMHFLQQNGIVLNLNTDTSIGCLFDWSSEEL